MKKIISLSVLSVLMLTMVSYARTTYNPDNTINVSSTIRGQKKARAERLIAKKKMQAEAAAAAKINYNSDIETTSNKSCSDKK